MSIYTPVIRLMNSIEKIDFPFELMSILPSRLIARMIITIPEPKKEEIYKEAKRLGKIMAKSFEESMTPASLKEMEIDKKITWEKGEFAYPFKVMGGKFGWGECEILDVSEKRIIKRFYENSIAGNVLKDFGKQKKPICYWYSGIIAGFYSGIMKKDMYVKETKCLGCGDEYCEFMVKLK